MASTSKNSLLEIDHKFLNVSMKGITALLMTFKHSLFHPLLDFPVGEVDNSSACPSFKGLLIHLMPI